MKKDLVIVPVEIIERKIYLIRGLKVMLDNDLAWLYEIETFNLNKAVKRNLDRFPKDFMFQLNDKEFEGLRFQNGISKGRGGRRYLPYVFTEHGVAMLSSILNSKKAVQVNIAIVRAFIKLRELLASHKDLISEIEKIKREQKGQNQRIQSIINIINQMLNPPIEENKEPIGFRDRGLKTKN
jgi:phage regulator Rha-like protein